MTRSIERHLREQEENLLRAEVRKSAARMNALLADEFVEFGSSGRVFGKPAIRRGLRDEPGVRRSLSNFKARELAPGVVLTTYLSVRTSPGERPARSLRSSIWKLIDGRWRMIFHQGTPSKQALNRLSRRRVSMRARSAKRRAPRRR